ncbi:MAG TPA: hypothetical protein PKA41_11550 [Verrucomicrobiota bacterium]|nr:hypothetical protein [Verrucomicrobiota bacterium]
MILFHRWDIFFIVRPDYREDGFRRPLGVGDLNKAFQDLSVRHNMAVVLVGWNYDPRDMKQIVQGWRSVLGSHGFRRVVCLYGDDSNRLDGAPIIDDWKRPVEQITRYTPN